jgi:predicted lipoprotein with Yx(FWY)xxD motif
MTERALLSQSLLVQAPERRRLQVHRLCVPLTAAFVLWTQSEASTESALENSPYPGAVALGQSAAGAWIYKSFPQLLPLYIFKGEPAGHSLCDRACTAVWPIVRAQSSDKPMGLWSIVRRDDGRLQWAYKGRPVYTCFEDRPNEPKCVGKNMNWYLDEQASAYLASVGVRMPPPLLGAEAAQTRKVSKIQAVAELLQP